ncbi:MAG TPA: ferritin-like domain-containing protein [Gaiellaceae bacterium]|jgi:hypothetical protein
MTEPARDPERPETRGPLDTLLREPSSRARFLKLMGGGVAGATALGTLLAACGGDDSGKDAAAGGTTGAMATDMAAGSSAGSGDVAIVNYALTLEYVEADFYDRVVASGLFKGAQLDLLKSIREHEHAHVGALTQTVEKLGGMPAAKPETRFPLDDAKSVANLAATVENLGAAAYLGQAANIESMEVLAAALSIHSVEARHASALNTLTGRSPTPDGAFARPASMDEVLPKVKPFIVG